jgi:citrate lyase beta subunit
VNLGVIASADRRLDALVFGAEDYAVDVGAERTEDGWEVFYARSALVTFCAANNLQAIDMVYTNFKDLEALRSQSIQGAKMGFTGKQVIHPDQVQIVQTAFTPTDQEIQEAEDLISQFATQQLEGRGAFAINGKMIDAPIIKAAQSVLERARAAGKIT